jgi:hypothetical protein
MQSKIPVYLKIILVRALIDDLQLGEQSDIELVKQDDTGYETLEYICSTLDDSIPTPVKIDVVCMLMGSEKYKLNAKEYFLNIINDQNVNCDFRFKSILSLENLDNDKQLSVDKTYFLRESCLAFLHNTKNMTMYRILSAQYLLQKCKLEDPNLITDIEQILLSIAKDEELDNNLRADAADCLLNLGTSDEIRYDARDIIICLGVTNRMKKTIYDNSQNVHTKEFEESITKALEFLSSIPLLKIDKMDITFDYVDAQIKSMMDKEKRIDKTYDDQCKMVELALNRIQIDNALYSKYNCSLVNILLKVWTYITSHVCQEEMKKRLYEELIDMSGTCSTGFASRLVNSISGFGDFNFNMSWEDQIVANFTGRLNDKIRKITETWITNDYIECIFKSILQDSCKLEKQLSERISSHDISNLMTEFFHGNNIYTENEGLDNVSKDEIISHMLEDFQANVMMEMSIPPSSYSKRKHFLMFFGKSMLSIREEMYEEFKDHIEDTDFDLYMRKAIMIYEGIN